MAKDERLHWTSARSMVAHMEAKMSDEERFETKSAELQKRRPYAAPTISDFFQPLVVLGTTGQQGIECGAARPRPPKQ